ncbi:MAG: hypothetical protein EPN48_18415 [Microbacteriaceae bacterium]|nr:MAG: hypothetical protein EPN48_18415 [Microbacteriaceae bacterium]
MFDQVDERLTPAQLQERFREWCAEIWNRVCATSPRLQYSWSGNRDPDQAGYFSHGPRFVHLGMMQDGRVNINGLESAPGPLTPGQCIPHAPVLFPGGFATLLSMNDDGADLAAQAIATWLLKGDDHLEDVRAAVRRHQAELLR